jgi:hypothetical protein
VSQHLLAFLALFGDRVVELAVSRGLFVVWTVFRMRVLDGHVLGVPPATVCALLGMGMSFISGRGREALS